jgi:hypothetical protein
MRNINRKNPERGAVVVEFALVLPLLMFLLMGMIEFGLLFYNQQVLTNASREGARAGIAHLTENEIKTIVVDYSQARLITFGAGPNVIANDVTVDGELGSYPENLTVGVEYSYTFLVPELLGFGTSMHLNAETVMNMESEEE